MSRLLFEARAAVLACEAQQALIEKEIELEKLKQQRTWQGLTVCERTECFNSAEWNDLTQYAEVIEAKLKEKNT